VGTYLVPISLASYGVANTMFAAALISLFGALISWWMAPETSQLDLQQAAGLGGRTQSSSPTYNPVARKA